VARTGRRPGNQDTRDTILAAARDAFAEKGYDGASIRHIATSAGVDPALVHHYFGTKDQLFRMAMKFPVDPSKMIPLLAGPGVDGFGERLITMFLSVWDSPAGAAAAGLLRSAVQHEWTARLLREFMTTQILRRAMAHFPLDPAEAPLRSNLIAAQMVGLALMRYIIKLEPLASAPPDVVVAAVAPVIQRYLTEPIKT
jgi:AcrR family transcriptional regulator